MGRPLVFALGIAAGLVAATAIGAAIYFVTREPEPGGLDVIASEPGGGVAIGARILLAGELRVTDRNGIVSYRSIPPGSYDLTASAPGFGQVKRSVKVESGREDQVHIRLVDAHLSGHFVEIAAEPSPPVDAKVTVKPQIGPLIQVPVQRDGSFSVDHLPVGKATIDIAASVESNTKRRFPRYDFEPMSVQLRPGANGLELKTPLSPVETFVRWNLLLEDGRFANVVRAGHRYHHPDAVRYGCPPLEYAHDVVRWIDAGIQDNDFQVLRARSLVRWTFHVGRRRFTYRNAAEMTVRFKYPLGISRTGTLHAVQVGELWKTFPGCEHEG